MDLPPALELASQEDCDSVHQYHEEK